MLILTVKKDNYSTLQLMFMGPSLVYLKRVGSSLITFNVLMVFGLTPKLSKCINLLIFIKDLCFLNETIFFLKIRVKNLTTSLFYAALKIICSTYFLPVPFVSLHVNVSMEETGCCKQAQHPVNSTKPAAPKGNHLLVLPLAVKNLLHQQGLSALQIQAQRLSV